MSIVFLSGVKTRQKWSHSIHHDKLFITKD